MVLSMQYALCSKQADPAGVWGRDQTPVHPNNEDGIIYQGWFLLERAVWLLRFRELNSHQNQRVVNVTQFREMNLSVFFLLQLTDLLCLLVKLGGGKCRISHPSGWAIWTYTIYHNIFWQIVYIVYLIVNIFLYLMWY